MTTTGPSLGRSSALLASGTMVSRLLGFASALFLANTIGTVGGGADAFAVANQIPSIIYVIISSGVLAAVIVPQIVRAGAHEDGGQAFTSRIVTLGLVIFAAITVLVTVGAPVMVWLFTQLNGADVDPAGADLAVAFAYWCLPQVFFYGAYAILGEVLNARKVYGPFTWAPAINNIVFMGGIAVFLAIHGNVIGQGPDQWTPGMIALLGGSATLGIVAQALVLVFFWRFTGLAFRLDFRWRGVGLRHTSKLAGWTFAMMLLTQIVLMIQTNVEWTATGYASVATVNYASLLLFLPHSLIAVSIGVPYFTRMSASAADPDHPGLGADLAAALRIIMCGLVFALVAMVVFAPVIGALFAREYDALLALGFVLIAFLVGLLPLSTIFMVNRAFFAMEDTRTPFLLQLSQSIVIVIACVLIAIWMPPEFIAVSVSGAASLGLLVNAVLSLIVISRRLPDFAPWRLVGVTAGLVISAIPAIGAGIGVLALMGGIGEGAFPVSSFPGALVTLALGGAAMAAVYLATLILTRNRVWLQVRRDLLSRA